MNRANAVNFTPHDRLSAHENENTAKSDEMIFCSFFSGHDEAKIRARLAAYNLGQYDHERVAALRIIHEDMCDEISQWKGSEYYMAPQNSDFAELTHFDLDAMTRDYTQKYLEFGSEIIRKFIEVSIHYWYLR